MKINHDNIFMVGKFLLAGLFGISFFVAFVWLVVAWHDFGYSEPGSVDDIVADCYGLDLFDTAECLNGNVNTVYSFVVTDDDLVLSFEDMVRHGGDCKNWAELYVELGAALGFYSKKIFILNEIVDGYRIGHSFAVISDEEGYCILDGSTYACKFLEA